MLDKKRIGTCVDFDVRGECCEDTSSSVTDYNAVPRNVMRYDVMCSDILSCRVISSDVVETMECGIMNVSK